MQVSAVSLNFSNSGKCQKPKVMQCSLMRCEEKDIFFKMSKNQPTFTGKALSERNKERVEQLLNLLDNKNGDESLVEIDRSWNWLSGLDDMAYVRDTILKQKEYETANPRFDRFFLISVGNGTLLQERRLSPHIALERFWLTNDAFFNTLQNYLDMEKETSDYARCTRNIVNELTNKRETYADADMQVFYAECLLNGKLRMAKLIADNNHIVLGNSVKLIVLNKDEDDLGGIKPENKSCSRKYKMPNSDKEFVLIYPMRAKDDHITKEVQTCKLSEILEMSGNKNKLKNDFSLMEDEYERIYEKTRCNHTEKYVYGDLKDLAKICLNTDVFDIVLDYTQFTREKVYGWEWKYGEEPISNTLGLDFYRDEIMVRNLLQKVKDVKVGKSEYPKDKQMHLVSLYKEMFSHYYVDNEKQQEFTRILPSIDVDKLYKDGKGYIPTIVNLALSSPEYLQNYVSKKYEHNLYDLSEWNDFLQNHQAISSEAVVGLVLNNLVDVFYTAENHEEYKNIVEQLRKVNASKFEWNIVDELGNNLAHRAIDAENPLLLELAKEKGVNFEVKNSLGKTAIELLRENYNNPLFKDVKLQSDDLVKYAKKGLATGVKIMLTNPVIDVNSVDILGDSIGIIAARNGNADIIRLLNSKPNFNVNYTNPYNFVNAYSVAKDEVTLQALQENPDFDLDKAHTSLTPLLFNLLNDRHSDKEVIKSVLDKMSRHPDFTLELTYNNKKLADELWNYSQQQSSSLDKIRATVHGFYEVINSNLKNTCLKDIRKIVDENGILTLEQIKYVVDNPKAKEFINEPLNDFDEPIGFFIADIEVNLININGVMEVVEKIKDLKYDFALKNKMGQTVLEKAQDAENDFLVELLKNVGDTNENNV